MMLARECGFSGEGRGLQNRRAAVPRSQVGSTPMHSRLPFDPCNISAIVWAKGSTPEQWSARHRARLVERGMAMKLKGRLTSSVAFVLAVTAMVGIIALMPGQIAPALGQTGGLIGQGTQLFNQTTGAVGGTVSQGGN